ncbi:MAG TPA: hypothetical protein VFE46_16260 [Pirellulales bacterium]|jgi:hypothetical protein|nr:hypothetical protein [Pirellulales bacterium]
MSDVTFVISRALSRDGIDYSISVYRRLGGFFAFWECKQCANQGSPTEPLLDRDTAIGKCEEKIEEHHGQYHNGQLSAIGGL